MEYTSVIPMREIQRNYASLIKTARHSGQPLIFGSHGKAQAVLMDIASFRSLTSRSDSKKDLKWRDFSESLRLISKRGKQQISLADFIRHDRRSH